MVPYRFLELVTTRFPPNMDSKGWKRPQPLSSSLYLFRETEAQRGVLTYLKAPCNTVFFLLVLTAFLFMSPDRRDVL